MAHGLAKTDRLEVVDQLPAEMTEAKTSRLIYRIAMVLGRHQMLDRLIRPQACANHVLFTTRERHRQEKLAPRLNYPGALAQAPP